MKIFEIPTNNKSETISEILAHLTYSSYKANRDYGCTHESLVNVGIGNEEMKIRYEEHVNTSFKLKK